MEALRLVSTNRTPSAHSALSVTLPDPGSKNWR